MENNKLSDIEKHSAGAIISHNGRLPDGVDMSSYWRSFKQSNNECY